MGSFPVQNEKIIVFDEDGNPKELRYYEAEKLVARLGTILDGNNNFIGLRELDVEAVSPSSWLERAKGLFGKQAPKRIDILTVDFIGLINWINTIKTIKTIENIKSIEEIVKIINIKNIERMRIVQQDNLIGNGDFETGTLAEWVKDAADTDIAIVSTQHHSGSYCLALRGMGTSSYVEQSLSAFPSSDVKISLWLKGGITDTIRLGVYYTDGTSDALDSAVTANWVQWCPTLTSGKFFQYIRITHDMDTVYLYVDDVKLTYKSMTISSFPAITIRTNLLNKPEREDLLLKDLDFTANAALQSYLAAVGSQKHKVYAYGYESDADGIYYFSATVNGSAFKFGRRITKGVMVQTLVHPIVCDVNTALNFMSTTGNSKVWIQYKTEA